MPSSKPPNNASKTKYSGVYKLPDGRLFYRGNTFKGFNTPKDTNNKDKKHKKMVLAKDGEKVKLVRYGAKGYSDFTKHGDPKRRERYRKRHGAIKTKDGQPAYKNRLNAAYWSWNDLW